MHIVIIPGFTGHPYERTFEDLSVELSDSGHTVHKLAYPNYPDNLAAYSMSAMMTHTDQYLSGLDPNDVALLGFSMGGIIASFAASKFQPRKFGVIVSPYQMGSEDDLSGKYSEWKSKGYRTIKSTYYGEMDIPFSFVEDARQYNALEVIGQVTSEKLFIAGELDIQVKLAATRKLFDAANEPKQWHQFAGMEHKYQYQPEMLKQVNKLIVDFVS